MHITNYLSKDTHALKINWLKEQLSKLPRGYLTNRVYRGVSYERVVILTDGKSYEKSTSTVEGKILADQIYKRQRYKAELKELLNSWNALYKIQVPSIIPCDKYPSRPSLDSELFINLQSETNDFPKERWNEYDGINFRSIQERTIAEVIKGFGWEYKYEVPIISNGIKMSCDFAINFVEINRIKFLEFFGMMDDEKYRDKVKTKINNYHQMGFLEDRDILFLYGNSRESINPLMIASKLNMAIANHI